MENDGIFKIKRRALIEGLTAEDLCGQLLRYDLSVHDDPVEVERIVCKIKPGNLYILPEMSRENVRLYRHMVRVVRGTVPLTTYWSGGRYR